MVESLTKIAPCRLLLIDGVGALISAVWLGLIWVHWHELIGIPVAVLYFLAVWPVLFAVYDFSCYGLAFAKCDMCLRNVAWLNLSYCVLSVAMLIWHYPTLTGLGWIYFLLEIGIVLLLAYVEWRVATKERQ